MNRLLLSGLLLAALPSFATRVERLTPAQLRSEASAVLIVDVLDATARTGNAGSLWTDFRVRVVQDLRDGTPVDRVLTLSFSRDIAGVRMLEPGARYEIYVDDTPARPMPVAGWTQGLTRIPGMSSRAAARDLGGWAAPSSSHPPARSLATLGMTGESCTCGGFASTPVELEIDHLCEDWQTAAIEAFDSWNAYIDVFHATPGDGVMGVNGINEIGFLDRAATVARYGVDLGPHVIAATFRTPLDAAGDFESCPRPADATCGTFVETDVILNRDFARGFRATGPPDYTDTIQAMYTAAAAHELGHVLGFHHNRDTVSVMNLYEEFAAGYLSTADTKEARNAYPSSAKRVADLATYPFSFDRRHTEDAATTPVELMTTHVARGGSIAFRNFAVENPGTEPVEKVRLELYLSTDAAITPADRLVGALDFGTMQPGDVRDDGGTGNTVKVPQDVPAGTYYLGAILTSDPAVDEVARNDAWVAPGTIVVTEAAPRRRPVRP